MNILNDLKGLFAPMPVMQLAAIHLEKAIKTGETVSRRIAPGDKISLKDNVIQEDYIKPTHEIVKCFGKPTSDFSIEVIDLETAELSIVNL